MLSTGILFLSQSAAVLFLAYVRLIVMHGGSYQVNNGLPSNFKAVSAKLRTDLQQRTSCVYKWTLLRFTTQRLGLTNKLSCSFQLEHDQDHKMPEVMCQQTYVMALGENIAPTNVVKL